MPASSNIGVFIADRTCNTTVTGLFRIPVKYDVHTTRKIKFIHAIIYHILLFHVG